MAKRKSLVNVNFNKNEIQNVVIENLSAAPSSPKKGQIYYDATLNMFGVYNNSAWVYLITQTVQDWASYSEAISWTGTYPSGTTYHEYSYVQIGKVVNGYIRLSYSTAGASNTVVTLDTNNFPTISPPSNADNNQTIIGCNGYIDTKDSLSVTSTNTRAWLIKSANTSGFQVKVQTNSIAAKCVIVSFRYMTN